LASVIGVVIFGRLVLSMFGPDFVRAFPILLMLVVSQLIRAAFGPSMLTLISAGAQKNVVIVFSIAIVGFALGNLILVPMFGLIGAGAAFIVMTAFWTAALALISNHRLGLRLDIAASFGVWQRSSMTRAKFVSDVAKRFRN
jgi:O-antigen/teichoic acid export membrane protein